MVRDWFADIRVKFANCPVRDVAGVPGVPVPQRLGGSSVFDEGGAGTPAQDRGVPGVPADPRLPERRTPGTPDAERGVPTGDPVEGPEMLGFLAAGTPGTPRTPERDLIDTQAVWSAADWRECYEERASIQQFEGGNSRARAEQLAWIEILTAWHMLHGRRWPAWQCAGCDAPICGDGALSVGDGNRIHLHRDCLAAYSDRWRGAAAAALVALGLEPPHVAEGDE